MHIKNQDGIIYDYIFSKNINSSYFLKVKSLEEGSYSFISKYDNSNHIVNGEFTIIPKKIESKMNTANHQILYQLSKESNAEMFNDFNIEGIGETIKSSPLNKTILHNSDNVEPIIDKQWILILHLLFQ